MRVKTCTRCGLTKPLDQFPPVRRSEPEKLQFWCRACFAEANTRNYWNNHEREKARLLPQTTRKREDNRRRAINTYSRIPASTAARRTSSFCSSTIYETRSS